MSRSVLVGVDEHEPARDAVTLGSALACALHDELIVLNVYPDDPLSESFALGAPPDEVFAGLAQEVVQRAASDAPAARRVTTAAHSVAAGLHQYASHDEVELLAVGSSHRSAVGRVLLGTNATRAVQGAPCAVAVAPRGLTDQDWSLREIAVAYDGSEEADEALTFARRIAAAADATIRLVTIIPTVMTGWGSYVYVPDPAGAYRQLAHEHAEREQQAAAHAGERREIRDGRTVDELLAVSRDVDLLLIGSRSYGPVRRLMLGSTSQTVVLKSSCPVIVVPRGARSDEEEHDLPRAGETLSA